MWVSRAKWKEVERRITTLEKEQLSNTEMIVNYIKDSESNANLLRESIDRLPEELEIIIKQKLSL